jgi:hypothetical protein
LIAGQQKLAARIEKAEIAAGRESAAIDQAGASIVSQIKSGLDWSLNAVRKKRSAVSPDLAVEKSAAIQLAAEIERKRGEIEDLDRAIAEAVDAALVEQAKTIADEYVAALESVRAAATKLEGLDVALQRGRVGRLVRSPTSSPAMSLLALKRASSSASFAASQSSTS